MLVHFRWATHGGYAPHLTHPFPLGPRALISRRLEGEAEAVLIHNGVWRDYLKFAPAGLDMQKWSDTAVAAYTAGIVGEEILDHVAWSTAVGRAAGDGRFDVTLRGTWTPHKGNLYSNLSWLPRTDRGATRPTAVRALAPRAKPAVRERNETLPLFASAAPPLARARPAERTWHRGRMDLFDFISDAQADVEARVVKAAYAANTSETWPADGEVQQFLAKYCKGDDGAS